MKDAVLHARISVGGTELMGADIPSAQPMRSAQWRDRYGINWMIIHQRPMSACVNSRAA